MTPRVRMFWFLLRHFFRQFFVSDAIVPGSEGYRSTIPILAVLTAPGLMIPLFWLFPIYSGLAAYPNETQLLVIRYHQFFFITLSMAIACGVALVHWDRLFLTGRDYSILMPLPVPKFELYASKLVALFLFSAAFTLAVNSFSVILFPGVAMLRSVGPCNGANFFWGHAAGVLGGSLFSFFLIVTLQGVILSVFRKGAATILHLFQTGILLLLMVLLSLYSSLFESWDVLSGRLGAVQLLFPPFWFLGLAQTVAGSNEDQVARLGTLACWGLGLMLVGGPALQLIVRREQRFASVNSGRVFLGRLQNGVRRLIGWTLKTPTERATVFFLIKTLLRSPRHRLILTGFIGLGLGLSMATLWPRAVGVPADGIDRDLLAVPQIVTFLLIMGMRTAFSDPAEPAARWLFLLTLEPPVSRYLVGVRKLMVVVAVAPLLMLLPAYLSFFGWTISVLHFGFSLVLTLALIEVALFRFHRIPFTATYWPGSSRMRLWWAPLVLGFTFYAYSASTFESWLLAVQLRAVLFEAAAGTLLAIWYFSRHFFLDPTLVLSFELEDPDRLWILSLR